MGASNLCGDYLMDLDRTGSVDDTVLPLFTGEQTEIDYAFRPTYLDGIDLVAGADEHQDQVRVCEAGGVRGKFVVKKLFDINHLTHSLEEIS